MTGRDRLFWTLSLFFGTSIALQAIQRWTDDETIWVTLGVQAALVAVIMAAVVVVVRRSKSG